MNRVTQQRIAPVVTTMQVLVILEALVFLLAALVHTGIQIPALYEPIIPAAAVVEGTCALLFLISAYALISRRTWSWQIALAAHIFALVGVLIGIFVLSMGSGGTAFNNTTHRIMLVLIVFGLAFLIAPEGRALPFVRSLVRITGMVQIALGLIFWVSNNDQIVLTHVLIGTVFVLALWTVALLSARAGANPGMVALVFVWGLVIPIIGIAQVNILNGATHWIIQVIHLLIGMAGIGLGDRLATSVLRQETSPSKS